MHKKKTYFIRKTTSLSFILFFFLKTKPFFLFIPTKNAGFYLILHLED